MECKQCHRELLSRLDGSLGREECQAVDHHLAACSECRDFAGYLEDILSLEAAVSRAESDPWFFTRLMARLNHREPAVKPRTGWQGILQPVFLSFLLILAVTGGFFLGSLPHQTSSEDILSGVLPQMNEMEMEPLETFLMF